MIRKSKFDNLWIGLAGGLVMPMLTLTAVYFFKFRYITFDGMVKYLTMIDVFVKVISLCVLPNLVVFYIFLQTNHYKAVRGVLMATLLLTIGIFIYFFAR